MISRRVVGVVLAAGMALDLGLTALADPGPLPKRDLADMATGTYSGNVVLDAKGVGKDKVPLTITRAGPDTIKITSSYARIKPLTVKLARVGSVLQQDGDDKITFKLNQAKKPNSLELSADGVDWAGTRTTDLADTVEGMYHGDVISDARGSSRTDVMITVTRVAPNTVEVSSDYARLPPFRTRLTRAMQTIQMTGGTDNIVFLYDEAKDPRRLDITVADASWSGERH